MRDRTNEYREGWRNRGISVRKDGRKDKERDIGRDEVKH